MSAQARVLANVCPAGFFGLLLLGAIGMGAASAAEPEECSVMVEPAAAPAGSQFRLSGSGFSPTHLTLRAGFGRETTVELQLDGADPFEIPVASSVGDEGAWTATVYVDGTDCQATASFHVTLLSTADEALTRGFSRTVVPLPVVALLGLLGLGGGALLARRIRLV